LIVFLAVYSLFVIAVLPVRWWIGAKFIQPLMSDYRPTQAEAELLNTLDNTLYALAWAGYFAILLAIAVEIFRETTEGQVYRSR